MTARLDFVELPVDAAGASARFFTDAFGWSFVDYGPTYAATVSGDVDLGLQADAAERSTAPLPVIRVDDLEATLEAVRQAGGMITKPIFAFPGGRRFHFQAPGGNELAAYVAEDIAR